MPNYGFTFTTDMSSEFNHLSEANRTESNIIFFG